MKIHLEKAIFANRAPFDKLELDFNENDIAVLTAVNGKGKTTILSHIVDAFYEMARPYFQNFEDKQNKYYRLSSANFNLDSNLPSFVYLRFKTDDGNIDYVDIRNVCTEEQYNSTITIENKIHFNEIQSNLKKKKNIKKLSSNFNKDNSENIFNNNILSYFPSYRYETPGYLNEPYKIQLNFKKEMTFSGYLLNPIEVVTGLNQLSNWIMDIVLDLQYPETNVNNLILNLAVIISQTLSSKYNEPLRFGIGPRSFGSTRIQIVRNMDKSKIYPSIFNLSSGESALICLFGELLRQADNIKVNVQLNEITGIVLIDEIDKHLHIKLQKEVLPLLLSLFPNVQFIVSSHSPFLSMGLAEKVNNRSRIVDLDNFGISKDPTTNELYNEVYNMMIDENNRFKEMYNLLKQKLQEGISPLIITEGKTDIKHLKKAMRKLEIGDYDIEFFNPLDDSWGDSKLKSLLEHLSKIPQTRKIIGIFDRDVQSIISDMEQNDQPFKNYGNNVYAFCIPKPAIRENCTNISIEFYYSDERIKKEKDGRRLYFDNEIDYLYNKSIKKPELKKLEIMRVENDNSKKIFDEEKMCEVADWIHSKTKFADLVETDEDFISDFDFTNFNLIFNKIKEIINSNSQENQTPI